MQMRKYDRSAWFFDITAWKPCMPYRNRLLSHQKHLRNMLITNSTKEREKERGYIKKKYHIKSNHIVGRLNNTVVFRVQSSSYSTHHFFVCWHNDSFSSTFTKNIWKPILYVLVCPFGAYKCPHAFLVIENHCPSCSTSTSFTPLCCSFSYFTLFARSRSCDKISAAFFFSLHQSMVRMYCMWYALHVMWMWILCKIVCWHACTHTYNTI